MNQNEIVVTPAEIDVAPQPAVTHYQQIEAEFARYEAEAAAIKQRMDVLTAQRESLREQERAVFIPQTLARMEALGLKPEDLGFAAKASKSVAPSIHKYRNPETGATHSGKGSCPGWLTPEAKKDSRYLNPEWVANDEAKKAAKAAKAATQSKTTSSNTSATARVPASNETDAVSNGAPEVIESAERPESNSGVAMTVASVAVVDVAHAASNVPVEALVSNLN